MDTERMTRTFVAIRDARKEKKKEFEAEDRKLKEQQDLVGGFLLKYLNDNNQTLARTEGGTFWREEEIIPTGADWTAFYAWVREHDAFEFLHKRITATEVQKYMEEHDGAIPPGVSVFRKYTVNVRRT
jgi:hypothetical protein